MGSQYHRNQKGSVYSFTDFCQHDKSRNTTIVSSIRHAEAFNNRDATYVPFVTYYNTITPKSNNFEKVTKREIISYRLINKYLTLRPSQTSPAYIVIPYKLSRLMFTGRFMSTQLVIKLNNNIINLLPIRGVATSTFTCFDWLFRLIYALF